MQKMDTHLALDRIGFFFYEIEERLDDRFH